MRYEEIDLNLTLFPGRARVMRDIELEVKRKFREELLSLSPTKSERENHQELEVTANNIAAQYCAPYEHDFEKFVRDYLNENEHRGTPAELEMIEEEFWAEFTMDMARLFLHYWTFEADSIIAKATRLKRTD